MSDSLQPMNRSTPGLPVHHKLLPIELVGYLQTEVITVFFLCVYVCVCVCVCVSEREEAIDDLRK